MVREATTGDAEAFLRGVLAAMPSFIVRADADLKLRYTNRLLPQLSLDDVLGTDMFDFIEERSRAEARAAIERARETGEAQRYESEAVGPHGSVSHYEVHVAPIAEADGRFGVCIVANDVTAQVERQRELERNRARLDLALEATGIGLWNWDLATGQVEWSPRMHEITGREEPVAFDAYVDELVHPDDRSTTAATGARVFESGSWDAIPHRIVRPDGDVRWVSVTGNVTTDSSGKITRVTGGCLDLTEQMRLQSELRQAQKMQAVGNVTAGIAHNFNNMLMVIIPALEMLVAGSVTPGNKVVRNALHASQRAADMVKQLMTFSGQRPPERREAHRLSNLLSRAIDITSRSREPSPAVSCTAVSVNVCCDDGAIEQVLVNVLTNARDALAEAATPRPRIAASVAVVNFDRDNAPAELLPGRYARVRIEDNGPGMSQPVRDHIFEPFFTTKSITRGTGLGLATSYAIVREHDGWLDCTTAPGEGARFDIYLPATDKPPVEDQDSAAPAAMRVLIIDDEASLCMVLGETLRPEGFDVVAHTRAADALAMLETDADFGAILLDRAMPGTGGSALVPRLRALCAAPILYFTGQNVPRAEREAVDGVVLKPVMTADLVAAIRAVTDQPR